MVGSLCTDIAIDDMYYSEKHNLYFIRKRVKNFTLRMRNDGTALCTMPMRVSLEQAEKFVETHLTWLEKQRKKLARLAERRVSLQENEVMFRGITYTFIPNNDLGTITLFDHEQKVIRTSKDLSDDEHREEWYMEQAFRTIPLRVRYYAEKFGFIYKNITIRNQKTKWGSCSAQKNLNFNYKLIKMPDYVLDYIVIHELVHTQFLDHSEKFWNRVEECCPDYKKAELYLRREARLL